LKNFVTIFSTFDASVLKKLVFTARWCGKRKGLPVQKRCPAGYFFLAEILVGKEGRICDRPGEIDVLVQPLWGGDTVLQGALVEYVRWEFR
jgi:hypothetical protein